MVSRYCLNLLVAILFTTVLLGLGVFGDCCMFSLHFWPEVYRCVSV